MGPAYPLTKSALCGGYLVQKSVQFYCRGADVTSMGEYIDFVAIHLRNPGDRPIDFVPDDGDPSRRVLLLKNLLGVVD